MIEISRNYKTFIKVTQLQLTRPQFYNMTEQQRFNLLYDAVGGVEWGSVYDELFWTILFIGLVALLIFGVILYEYLRRCYNMKDWKLILFSII